MDSTTAGFLGPLSAILSACTWAIGVSVYSRLCANRPAYVVNFTRAATAFPAFIILAFMGSWGSTFLGFHQLGWSRFVWLTLSVVGSYGVGDALFLMSSQTLGVPSALAIGSSYPVWSALAGWIFKGEKLFLHQSLGLALVLIGVVIVILNRPVLSQAAVEEVSDPADDSHLPVEDCNLPVKDSRKRSYAAGVFLAVMVSIFWALNTLAVAKGGEGISLHVANAVRMGVALIFCPLIGFIFAREVRWPLISGAEYRGAFLVFVIETIGGSILYVYAFTHASLAVAASLTSLAPAISVPIALVTKSEKLSKAKIGGIALVVLGIAGLVT